MYDKELIRQLIVMIDSDKKMLVRLEKELDAQAETDPYYSVSSAFNSGQQAYLDKIKRFIDQGLDKDTVTEPGYDKEVFTPDAPTIVAEDGIPLGMYLPTGKYWVQCWGINRGGFFFGPLGSYATRTEAVERIRECYLGPEESKRTGKYEITRE